MTRTYNSERILRVQIDHFLSWSSLVQKTHTTIARHIALLCRIKKYLPYQARQTFYHSFILPHMDYCSTLRGDASAAERIHKLKKRAARVITESPYRTPDTPQDVILTQDVIIAARCNTIYARCNNYAKCNNVYARCNKIKQREM